MTCILVPVDGSKSSIRALAYLEQRRRRGEQFDVKLVNVQPPVEIDHFVSREQIKQWQKTEFASVAESKAVREALERFGAKIAMVIGDPGPAIVRFVTTHRCNEIVMGTRGLGAVKGLILGSVANKVLHLAAVPVTLVR